MRLLLASAGPAVVLACLCAPSPAAASLVVDGHSRGGPCSDARPAARVSLRAPWCSLSRAIAAGRGTVVVRGGDYPAVAMRDHRRPISFRAYGGERPTLPAMTISNSSRFGFRGFRFTSEVDLTHVSHLTFADDVSDLTPNGRATASGYLVTGVSDATWKGNRIADGWIGVHFRWGGAKKVRVVGNRFERLGGEGIHLQEADGVLVARNDFVDILPRADIDPSAHADAVQALGPSRHTVLDGNFVSGGRGFMIQFAPEDYGRRAAQVGMVVQNNLLTGRDFGIRVFSAPGIRILSNTVWGTETGPGSGIDLESAVGRNRQTERALLRDNIVKRLDVLPGVTYRDDHNLIATGPRRGRHDLSRPPLFRDPRGDWRLRPGSPGTAAGTLDGVPRRDREGRRRPRRPDLGSEQS